MPSYDNRAILAVAGALKTQTIIDEALGHSGGRVLVTTFTRENLRQIGARIELEAGTVPHHVALDSWFRFLLSEGVRPYQSAVLGKGGLVGGLNFKGQRSRYARMGTPGFYLDAERDIYRDSLAKFVVDADKASGGRVIGRLEAIYDHILIDEVQDLVGYDLDVLDLLLRSGVRITVVGDPRQHTLRTNQNPRNRKYRGPGFADWLGERTAVCRHEERLSSARCCQEVCDFASRIFPEMPPLVSSSTGTGPRMGIHRLTREEVPQYYAELRPQVLRSTVVSDTMGLPAMNFGVAKGSTFDRVLIFPTRPMAAFLDHGDPSQLKEREKLYVGVTRARLSVGIVT